MHKAANRWTIAGLAFLFFAPFVFFFAKRSILHVLKDHPNVLPRTIMHVLKERPVARAYGAADGPQYSTQVMVGNGGYNYIRNLYFYKGKLLLWRAPGAPEFDTDGILRNSNELQVASVTELPREPWVTLTNTTLILHEANHNFNHHMYHFVECLIGAFYVTYNVSAPAVSAAMWPSRTLDSARGSGDVNAKMLNAVFGPGLRLGSGGFFDLHQDVGAVRFDHAVVVDRESAHRTALVGKYNKMAADIMAVMPRAAAEALVGRMYTGLGLPLPAAAPADGAKRRKRITLVDRINTGRSLTEASRVRLLAMLARLTQFDFEAVQMEKLGFKEQIEVVSKTDILLGVHGNGLTHTLWLPPGSAMIEIFAADSCTLDYGMLAHFRGFQYFAIDEKKGLMTREEFYGTCPRGNMNAAIDADITPVETVLKGLGR